MYKDVIMFNFIRNLFGFNDNPIIIKGKLTFENKQQILSDLKGCDLIEKVTLSRAACSDDLALYLEFKKTINLTDETIHYSGRKRNAIIGEDESFVFDTKKRTFKITA